MSESSAVLWLPGHALNCYEGNAQLRSWLTHPGLLTQRVCEACPQSFSLNVLGEFAEGTEHVREVELCCDGQPWIFAQTRVPATTLALQGWLAHIGDTSLGEALAAHGSVTRSEFDYAMLADNVAVVARALRCAGLPSQALWLRRSVFFLDGAPLYLQEVFLPVVGMARP